MLTLSFMRHAFVASTFIAIICGIIGVFVVARNLSFLTHTLSEIGFAGGAFAVFAGWPALNGMHFIIQTRRRFVQNKEIRIG